MNLSQLPYIIAIAGNGSLAGAAQELGVSQSALSRYLSDLEKEVGSELFFSVKRKMYPTPAGRKYIQYARQILEVMETTKNDIGNLSRPVRELRVGVSPHGGARVLASSYFAFNRRFPSTRITPREGYANDLKEMIRRGEADIAISSGGEAPGLVFHPNSRAEVVLVLPTVQVAQYPQLEGKPSGTVTAPLCDFRRSVFVLSDRHAALGDLVERLMEREHMSPQVIFTSPNHTILRKLVSMGVGASLMSLGNAASEPGVYVVHLQDPMYMENGVYIPDSRAMTEEERFLHFLSFYDMVSRNPDNPNIIWNDFNRGLLREFSPDLVLSLGLEEQK